MSQPMISVKLTAAKGNSGFVMHDIPKDEVVGVIASLIGRNGLKRITLDWEQPPELKALDIIETVPTIDKESIKTNESNVEISHIDPILSEKPASQVAKQDSEFNNAPAPKFPPEPVDIPELPHISDHVDSQLPFKEGLRIHLSELGEKRKTDDVSPRLTYHSMGDGQVVINYGGSHVYTTWMAIKNLPENIPDSKLELLNGQKKIAVKQFKTWMIRRKQQQEQK